MTPSVAAPSDINGSDATATYLHQFMSFYVTAGAGFRQGVPPPWPDI